MKPLATNLLLRLLQILLSILLLIWLGSAVLLNHDKSLGLDKLKVNSSWLKRHYQIGELQSDQAFIVEGHVIIAVDQQLYVNSEPLLSLPRPLIGAVALENVLVVATDDALILLSKDGDYIDTLGAAAGIPPEIQNIGVHYNEPVLQTRHGMWRGNFLLDSWELMSLQGVSWSQSESMPPASRKAMEIQLYGDGVSVSQVLRDLHNGQLLKGISRWLLDIWLIVLLILGFRGILGITNKSH
ncbi:MAG TPA: peptidase [Methylophaga sp.]|nr:peptidase [Methylophaga sp.]